jgi:hypothetical protein
VTQKGNDMDNATKRTFVRAWKAEYAACVKANALRDKIDTADALGRPTARLESQLKTQNAKMDKALEPVISLISTGEIDENATAECRQELGNLYGYAGDCYISLYHDFKPGQ